MKIVKYIFLVIWTIWSIIGILGNYSRYKATDWIFILLFVAMPYLILWYLTHRKIKKKKEDCLNIIKDTSLTADAMGDILTESMSQSTKQIITQSVLVQTNIKNESAAEKLETAQKMLNESLNQLDKAISTGNILKAIVQQSDEPSAAPKSGTSYIEDDKMIARTDGREISDDEIPYLIQVGREEAIAKWKVPELTRLISESYQIMQTTENPETLCNSYNFIVEKINELTSIAQKGLFDRNTLNQYNALISDNNFYNLIILCYQKYVTKAKSELKTQNGINKRINKFWNVIYQNVSAEFYNEKFKKGKA